jgi:hypothetical protein
MLEIVPGEYVQTWLLCPEHFYLYNRSGLDGFEPQRPIDALEPFN